MECIAEQKVHYKVEEILNHQERMEEEIQMNDL